MLLLGALLQRPQYYEPGEVIVLVAALAKSFFLKRLL